MLVSITIHKRPRLLSTYLSHRKGGRERRYDGARLNLLGIKGYLLKSASAQEVIEAIRTVRSGGTYIQPSAVEAPNTMANPSSSSDPTERELEVLRLVAEGLKNRGIADRLHVSERTVHYHLRNLFKKLKVTSRSELVFQSRQRGLIG